MLSDDKNSSDCLLCWQIGNRKQLLKMNKNIISFQNSKPFPEGVFPDQCRPLWDSQGSKENVYNFLCVLLTTSTKYNRDILFLLRGMEGKIIIIMDNYYVFITSNKWQNLCPQVYRLHNIEWLVFLFKHHYFGEN